MDYNWLVGHLSDLGAGGVLTALYLTLQDKMNYKLGFALGAPSFWALTELGQKGACDLQDIACYYGGSLAALLLKEVTETLFTEELKLDADLLDPLVEDGDLGVYEIK